MNLVGELASQLGIETGAAESLAGALLGGVKDEVAKQVGAKEATLFESAIPELSQWRKAATSLVQTSSSSASEGGLGGGLLAGALGALGGGQSEGGLLGALTGGSGGGLDATTVAQLLGKLNLNPALATTIAPIVLKFIRARLPADLVQKVMSVVPLLSSLGGGGLSGALGGLLGGLKG